ncbi:hypothetical protein [Streptomyces sp. SID3343]|uniref:hypothetical protein n=1 Tax=Streptomyces sp. SID3343 TaxID=2690260 RepID=UPI0013703A79|nr:hypothetical protein [Streptomyces sp. SID3343]MYW06061.1 hypothetical protein [Streptomyces sp. SID3343]
MLLGVIARRLNDGVDYARFREAWLPDEQFEGDPRRVVSAINLEDPQELVTVALVDAEVGDIPGWMDRIAASEQRRGERIRGLLGSQRLNGTYRVVGDDDFARPITR